jgi:hypothetical protein
MAIVRNYVLPSLVLLAILIAWDFTKPRNPGQVDAPLTARPTDRPNGGVPPWNANEILFHNSRDEARRSALRGLDRAWSVFCTPAGRKKLAETLTSYFRQRRQEEVSYPKRWDDQGRDYINQEWSTSDDRRIERLVTEFYERGYLDLGSLRPYVVEYLAPLLEDTHVQEQPCKP